MDSPGILQTPEVSTLESLPPYQDDLPAYTPSLQFYGLALLKIEFDTPWSACNSTLQPVVVELNSNQLNMYEFSADKTTVSVVKSLFKHQNYAEASLQGNQTDGGLENNTFDFDNYGDSSEPVASKPMFSKLRSSLDHKKTQKVLSTSLTSKLCHNILLLEPTSDKAIYDQFAATFKGKLLRSYTLSNLIVGEAPCLTLARLKKIKGNLANAMTLINYRNTLRLRVEYTQLLLHFWSFHAMAHWFRNMSVGRDLASSIDNRKLSLLKSIPRSFSAANNALLEESAREALTFNPETQKMVNRDSFSSAEDRASCFNDVSLVSGETEASIFASMCAKSCKNIIIDVNGFKLTCLENIYTPIEKQYILKCLPVLNSFDKWAGSKLTISNFEHLMPKQDDSYHNPNKKVFISRFNFTDLVRSYNKKPPIFANKSRKCREFYIDDAGLISLRTDEESMWGSDDNTHEQI